MSGVHENVGRTQRAQPFVCDLSINMEMEDKMQLSISTYTNHLLGANMQYFTDPWRPTGVLGEYGREGWCSHRRVLRR